jgi:hypothetical protein
MTLDQILLFSLFGGVFGLLLWGRFRYDMVAFGALCLPWSSASWRPKTPLRASAIRR